MEQMEVTKTDVEKKVERILKLVKRRSKKKEAEIIALVEDFHRQYQSLYAQYEHLKRETGEKSPKGEGNESHPYYASGQESEYYSPTDVETETDTTFDNNRGSHRWMADSIKEELKRAYGEDVHQLSSKTQEKAALASDHLAGSSQTQEIENVDRDESEVDDLRKQRIKSEYELRSNIHEINQLREEKSHLDSRIIELEALFRKRGLELSAQEHKSKWLMGTAHMNTEVEHSQMEKTQIEFQTADQQVTLKEIKENSDKSMESDPKLVKPFSIGNKLNYQVLERKMEGLAQEFYQNVDHSIRLLCLRIAVVEKTHHENKESYKKIKERLDQQNEAVKPKINVYLETKLCEEEEQKLKLLKAVNVLENRVGELEKINKEKDETLLSRDEEKREAIRQLCVLTEYHRSRCHYLKESISKFIVRIKKRT